MQNSSSDLRGGEDSVSAISWPAIIGGTFAATALSLVLIAFGSGMGFALAPHFIQDSLSAKHLTYIAVVWLIVVQWIASGLGGYLTGRLRTKWTSVHTHEVFFRDTAHGFLTWSVTTVVSVVFLMSAVGSLHGLPQERHMRPEGPMAYEVDNLFRTDRPGVAVDQDTKTETSHILMKGVAEGGLSATDKTYLSQIVAAHTGLTQADAEKKIDDTVAAAQEQAEEASKTAATTSIFTLLSMMVGAFIACVAAAIGGQERDIPYPR